MVVWALAKKEMRLLVRDRMAVVVLLGMPLVFILLWGLMLGENFGQKTADEKLRVVLVDLDQGEAPVETTAGVGLLGDPTGAGPLLAASAWCAASQAGPKAVGEDTWAKVVRRDLLDSGGVKVEDLPSVEEAQRQIRKHKLAAVLVFEPSFSQEVDQCSFLVGGINPFHHDGVFLDRIHAQLLRDSKQPSAAALIDQVAQVSLLRVILPWMIGQAFERLSDEQFIRLLGEQVNLPLPPATTAQGFAARAYFGAVNEVRLKTMLELASGNNETSARDYRRKVGQGVQNALDEQFKKYDLRGKTWAALTRSTDEKPGEAETPPETSRLFDFGGQRYQQLVPSFTVMFPFFLAMVVGWVFVTERRQGTLKRLRFAPVSRAEILAGKLLPVFGLSMGLAGFLLLAGRLIFQMTWGPDTWPLWLQVGCLLPVVVATSFASMGLALLVAAVSRSEIQVALYGALPVLVMALVSGCILPREMMTASAQAVSWFTPHGWALAAYRELLGDDPKYQPDMGQVWLSCAVLTAFGAGFLGLAWRLLRLD